MAKGVEYEFTNENRPKPQSQWNDPEMEEIYNPIGISMDIQNEKAEGESLQEYHAKHFNKEALDKRYSDMDAASKLISFTIENSKWIADVHNYCQQHNITPEELINAHRILRNSAFE